MRLGRDLCWFEFATRELGKGLERMLKESVNQLRHEVHRWT